VTLLFLSAFGLGLAYCAPPGAVTAEASRRGLERGFRSVLLLELGSLIGDATWAALALAGAAVLVQYQPVRLVLGLAGACFLLHLAWIALQEARVGALPKAVTDAPKSAFGTGVLLSLANPYAIAFWLGVGGAMVTLGVPNPQPMHFAIFFGGFMLAALCWCFLLASLIAGARQFVRPALFRWVNLLCGIVLLCFGLRLFAETLSLLV
jgi:threonine/homoserine/homoserine lactone efflux protein